MRRRPPEGSVRATLRMPETSPLPLEFRVLGNRADPENLDLAGSPDRRLVPAKDQGDRIDGRVSKMRLRISGVQRLPRSLCRPHRGTSPAGSAKWTNFCDVIEPIADVIRGKQIGRAKVEADQVANRIVKLGPVEAAELQIPGNLSIGCEGAIEPAIDRFHLA